MEEDKWIINQVSTKIIKPSTPTPSHHKIYNLNRIDQYNNICYIPIALFYPSNTTSNEISQILEKSLSKLLTFYYPLAGTLSPDGNFVECNDIGAQFSEVAIKCKMYEFMEETNARVQDIVFENKFSWGNSTRETYLLYVQLNHFDCGGKALSFRLSHGIADGCSVVNFVNDWAAMNMALLRPHAIEFGNKKGEPKSPSPEFIGASLIPPIHEKISPPSNGVSNIEVTCKRYKFDGKSLAQLKALIIGEDDGIFSSIPQNKPQYITRTELVTALLFKCIVAASAKIRPQLQESTSSIKHSGLLQVVNLRRVTPLVAPNVVGNLCIHMDLVIENEENMKLSRLIKGLKKGKYQLQERIMRTSENDLSELVIENTKRMEIIQELDGYTFSSFCGYPIYNIDFGFGKPIWAILGSSRVENIIFLMENIEGDGIEAMVTLNEKVMSILENEEEIRTYASGITYPNISKIA